MTATALQLSNLIRREALQMCSRGKSSHIGSVLSCADILGTLYAELMNFDPSNPKSSSRDRFVMSKGHAGAGVYAALAHSGFVDPKILETHYQNGSYLSGHVCHAIFPGIEVSTGSLGHGLPIACGISLSLKLKRNESKVFVLMSDGELDEGSNWEAFLFGNHHNLHNLNVFIDRNMIQSIESTEKTLSLEPLTEKLHAFGWHVENINGHDHGQIIDSVKSSDTILKPKVYICSTVKGKGISFMENEVLWHYRSPNDSELQSALNLLS